MSDKILVKHKKSGLIYAAWPLPDGYYRVTANDGLVPGTAAEMDRAELEKLFEVPATPYNTR